MGVPSDGSDGLSFNREVRVPAIGKRIVATFVPLNARGCTVEELLPFDAGRKRERDLVRQAILDSRHNVLLCGSRGSGKTFFQKTQAHYFQNSDDSILTVFAPCEPTSRGGDLPILSLLFMAWWRQHFRQSKTSLLEASAMDGNSTLTLTAAQRKLIELYRVAQATELGRTHQRTSQYGATAVVKVGNSVASVESSKRGGLNTEELRAVLYEFAELAFDSSCKKIVVHLDEAELLAPNDETAMLDFYLNTFNPVGIQFVATAAPTSARQKALLGDAVETTVELEGLDNAQCLAELIRRYTFSETALISSDALDVLYEFFKGHPRMSLWCCARALELLQPYEVDVGPKAMTRACLEAQARQKTLEATRP